MKGRRDSIVSADKPCPVWRDGVHFFKALKGDAVNGVARLRGKHCKCGLLVLGDT